MTTVGKKLKVLFVFALKLVGTFWRFSVTSRPLILGHGWDDLSETGMLALFLLSEFYNIHKNPYQDFPF